LRELVIMAEARRREAWDHTACILSLIYNANRGPHSQYLPPSEFHPYQQQEKQEHKPVVGVDALKSLLFPS
jgi:hypothetical protein